MIRAVVLLTQQHAVSRDEFLHLVDSADYVTLFVTKSNVRKIDAATYVGKGHIDFLLETCAFIKPDVILVDVALSARHTRNIQKKLCVDLVDRTELILRIFEKRATSFEGKLQVELAKLNYMATKLVRGWTHLERQRGGIGLRAGPGETQIEVDRRLLRDRITKTQNRIKQVAKTRKLNRQHRLANNVFNIAIIGYTNAGKSSLFNLLTNATDLADDKLFVTLDPKTRTLRKYTANGGSIILTDTVGFIEDLPKPLLEAFASTLDEIVYADLLLHVVDIADPNKVKKMAVVDAMLDSLGANNVPVWTLYNKCDLLTQAVNTDKNNSSCHYISVHDKLGIEHLLNAILNAS